MIKKVLLRSFFYAAAIIIPIMTPLFIVFFSENIEQNEKQDLQAEITGNALEDNLEKFMPRKIFSIGIHIDDLSNIQVSDQTFESRFIYWAKNYFDRSKNDRSKVEEDFITIVNNRDLEIEHKETHYLDEALEEFLIYTSYEVNGYLKNTFHLSKYPFDKHTLKIIFEPKEETAEEILLTIDPNSTLSGEHSLKSWKVKEFKANSDVYIAKNDFSDPETINKGTLWTSIPRATFEIVIERNILSHLVKELFPLLLITIIIYINLFIPPSMFEIRAEIAVTAFLTITALHWVASEELGSVSYLTAMDQFFLVSYGLVLLIIIEAIISRDLLPKDDKPNEIKRALHGHWFRIVIPTLRIIFPLFLATTWYWIAFTANT